MYVITSSVSTHCASLAGLVLNENYLIKYNGKLKAILEIGKILSVQDLTTFVCTTITEEK